MGRVQSKDIEYGITYWMQIVSVECEYVDCGCFAYYKYTFLVRVWPDLKQDEKYHDILFSFCDKGRAEKYLQEFIETATGYEYYGINLDDVIGAVFKGYISMNYKVDKQMREYSFLNITAEKHIGYAQVD